MAGIAIADGPVGPAPSRTLMTHKAAISGHREMRAMRGFAATMLVATVPVLVTVLPAPAPAQLSRGEAAILNRQNRAIQNRAVDDPGGAATDLGRQRRDLLRDNRGVNFGPEGARINRQLRALGNAPPPAGVPEPPSVASPGLPPQPGTLSRDPALLPSLTPDAAVVGQLLDRAENGINAGRRDQARSDLATADQGLAGLSSVGTAAGLSARAAALHARIGQAP